jgi:hypothetical protein
MPPTGLREAIVLNDRVFGRFAGGVTMIIRKNQSQRAKSGAILLCGVLCLSGLSAALAQWMDGEDLVRVCDPEQQGHVFRPGMCSGYIMAAIDLDEDLTARGVITKPLFCMAEDVAIPQVTAVVTRYIKAHPERRDDSAGMLVIDALGAEFPCKD